MNPKTKLKIYMGWDSRETVAYDVARRSIMRQTSLPKATFVRPLELRHLTAPGGKFPLLTRPIEKTEDGKLWDPISGAPMATEFAVSRFCVPFLQQKGWALFVDCDIVCLEDIAKLFALADPKYAVQCVQHNLAPAPEGATKMDGQPQTNYSRKNWSSVVLWNCAHPANKELTLEKLNTWPGRDLHAFKWLPDELIGALPPEWNHLVGIDSPRRKPAIAHFTLGGPWLPNWEPRPGDELWLREAGWETKA